MPDWVHQSSKKTNGDYDNYVFSVDKNNSSESREGVIVFCNDLNVCIPVNIKQAGAKANGENDDTTSGGMIVLE